jgi:hypothetical protein
MQSTVSETWIPIVGGQKLRDWTDAVNGRNVKLLNLVPNVDIHTFCTVSDSVSEFEAFA